MARAERHERGRHVLVRQQRLRPGLQRESRAAVRSGDAAPAARRRRCRADELGADERRRLGHRPFSSRRARRSRRRRHDDLPRRRSRDEHVRQRTSSPAATSSPKKSSRIDFGDRLLPKVAISRRRSPTSCSRTAIAIGKQVYLRSGSADHDDHRRRRPPAGAVDFERRHRECGVRAGVHAVRQLDALSRARRARPPRRSHEAWSSRK